MKSSKLTLLIATVVLGAGVLTAQSADPFATGGGTDAVSGATTGGSNRLTGVVKVDASGVATLAVGNATYELSFSDGKGAKVRSGTTVTVEGRVVSKASTARPVLQVNRLTVGAAQFSRDDDDEDDDHEERGGRGGRHDKDD